MEPGPSTVAATVSDLVRKAPSERGRQISQPDLQRIGLARPPSRTIPASPPPTWGDAAFYSATSGANVRASASRISPSVSGWSTSIGKSW